MFIKILFIMVCIWHCSSRDIRQDYLYDILHLSKVASNDVIFSLYTLNSTKLHLSNSDLMHLETELKFKFIVHGWRESSERSYFKRMTEAYFEKGNYNIIYVDWSVPAAVEYSAAVINTAKVGLLLGMFIIRLNNTYSVNLKNVHILGHSLGAHVAGYAGGTIYNSTGNKIGRITGLDPAGPLFEGFFGDFSRRLHKGDADMVDVIHTDGGMFGFKESIGTVDLFPNGGVGTQPGCSVLDISKRLLSAYVFCSHMKSHEYYIRSINFKSMIGVKCNSWMDFQRSACNFSDTVIFGEDIQDNATGNYYLRIT